MLYAVRYAATALCLKDEMDLYYRQICFGSLIPSQ
jgi:hypothetical protein